MWYAGGRQTKKGATEMKSLTKSSKPKLVAKDVQVQFALPVAGVLHDVQSAFFGLCVGAGKAVLSAMMEEDRVALCGPKGAPDPSRSAYRGGHTQSWVTLGGRKIAVSRPRARALEAAELGLPTFAWAAQTDPLNAATIAAISAGVSTRRYRTTLDGLPAGEMEGSISKSAVSRRFVALSSERLGEWLSRSLDDLVLPVVMIDGIHFRDRVVLIALGIDDQGDKHILGIREGSTENTRVVRSLLADLIERGLDAEAPRLWGIDGALYRTLRSTNPIENLNGLIAHYTRNVKRWKDGHMLLRWIGSSLHEAAGGFRCVRGFREMKRLCSVLLQRVQPDSLVQRKVA